MGTLHEAEKLLSSLPRSEKARLLQWVVRELSEASPEAESTPGVCGGEACVVRTRIPVWLLEQHRRQGTSEADILRAYPTFRAEDLVNSWAYVHSYQEEIEQLIRENETA